MGNPKNQQDEISPAMAPPACSSWYVFRIRQTTISLNSLSSLTFSDKNFLKTAPLESKVDCANLKSFLLFLSVQSCNLSVYFSIQFQNLLLYLFQDHNVPSLAKSFFQSKVEVPSFKIFQKKLGVFHNSCFLILYWRIQSRIYEKIWTRKRLYFHSLQDGRKN